MLLEALRFTNDIIDIMPIVHSVDLLSTAKRLKKINLISTIAGSIPVCENCGFVSKGYDFFAAALPTKS